LEESGVEGKIMLKLIFNVAPCMLPHLFYSHALFTL
jgi:hypothetical protein